VERELPITSPQWQFDYPRWQRFRELLNPFEPLLRVWETGYCLIAKLNESDGLLHLFVKVPDFSPAGRHEAL
jgi:hypothetical protein